MIIKHLLMHNFGVYAGDNIFRFTGKKPIVLIGGMNGRGKTTFLNAVLLALYGSKSFAFRESPYKQYGLYLRSFVNENDRTKKTFVELEFEAETNERNTYRIRRSWDGNLQRISEIIEVYKDGILDEFLTDNWNMYVEEIIPSGIASLFFFDGEKISELAAESSDEMIKDSIKRLLGINVIEQLSDDLGRTTRRVEKSIQVVDEKELVQKRELKEESEAKAVKIEEELAKLQQQKEQISRQKDEAFDQFRSIGGIVSEQKSEQEKRYHELETDIKMLNQQLIDLSASELPLFMVRSLLQNIQEQVDREREQKNNAIFQQKLDQLYQVFKEKSKSSKNLAEFIEYATRESDVSQGSPIYGFSDDAYMNLHALTSSRLSDTKKKTFAVMENLKKKRKDILNLEKQMSVSINDNSVKEIVDRMKQLSEQSDEIERQISEKRVEKQMASGDLRTATADFNKYVKDVLEQLELKDENERMIKYLDMMEKVMEEYSIRLQKTKLIELSETITRCYKCLANKNGMIETVEMSSTTLDLSYLNKQGDEVPKHSLSAGEKQMMVISILWALAICSKKKLPVIIDTPMSRLDREHRISLIKEYFPKASIQIILLSTDTEITHEYYDMMKDNIGDEFTLLYDDEKGITRVANGYFQRSSV